MVQIPAWWSGFIFHVLNPRQIAMYVYLIMLMDERGVCRPTIEQIRKDLGLLSSTMVFESIAVLEEYGFFVRSRQTLPESRSRRNVYRRTACEYTLLRLLEANKIDGALNAVGSSESISAMAQHLVQQGLSEVLGGGGVSSLRERVARRKTRRAHRDPQRYPAHPRRRNFLRRVRRYRIRSSPNATGATALRGSSQLPKLLRRTHRIARQAVRAIPRG